MYDPTLSHFDLDIGRGKTGELFCDDILRMLGERTGQIEVKNDRRFLETNRFYVEYECRGRDGIWRPSGIKVTKARLWAFVFGQQKPKDRMVPAVFIIETEWLRRAVSMAEKAGNYLSTDYGENPTRGIGVSMEWIKKTVL